MFCTKLAGYGCRLLVNSYSIPGPRDKVPMVCMAIVYPSEGGNVVKPLCGKTLGRKEREDTDYLMGYVNEAINLLAENGIEIAAIVSDGASNISTARENVVQARNIGAADGIEVIFVVGNERLAGIRDRLSEELNAGTAQPGSTTAHVKNAEFKCMPLPCLVDMHDSLMEELMDSQFSSWVEAYRRMHALVKALETAAPELVQTSIGRLLADGTKDCRSPLTFVYWLDEVSDKWEDVKVERCWSSGNLAQHSFFVSLSDIDQSYRKVAKLATLEESSKVLVLAKLSEVLEGKAFLLRYDRHEEPAGIHLNAVAMFERTLEEAALFNRKYLSLKLNLDGARDTLAHYLKNGGCHSKSKDMQDFMLRMTGLEYWDLHSGCDDVAKFIYCSHAGIANARSACAQLAALDSAPDIETFTTIMISYAEKDQPKAPLEEIPQVNGVNAVDSTALMARL
ncbi:hypothetical protein FOL47_008142 [Perkinsus chesapeaki]|uniref:Uncharacterized protein n=1 Tax=Perkinsus chesapeaki TaxID=330153 RepID=A0A7J6LFU7_PERCH|nr:hypothetical protein FOL47_008142 [Perkinsus chesapeaki]